ncbi:MAG TPA: recombination regulator RecX [Thauera aminoaromatica]|nr:recombination regulator RecX [Thauera aminoaromatica]
MDELRQRALRLLARREHSRAELRKKLAPHAESEEQLERLDALLDDLAGRRLLSDARYAEMRVSSRSARYGNARLAQELKQQGVSAEDCAGALEEAGDELARAHGIWARKFGTLPVDAADRARQTRFLISRGFSGETIRRVMRGETPEPEQD